MRKYVWLLLFTVSLSCQSHTKKGVTKLVVFISVDQLRPELLTQFNDLFTGGFRWLIDHSVSYTNVYHEHGYTATGPGHFVLSSGQYPGPVGVIGNNWYDRKLKRVVYCVEDTTATVIGYPGKDRSYKNINTTALGDWVKDRYPSSKVFSVAGKDRASIFLGGKHPNLALWYNWQGDFVTTDYYAKSNPQWLIDFNRNLNVLSYRDSLWTRSLAPVVYERYARRDNFPGEMDTYLTLPYSPVFPIGFDSSLSDSDVLNDIGGTPWLDKFTIELATTIAEQEKLGTDDNPDILFIGLSATDWIIHNFGPFSQESMDHLIKIDRYLGHFIDKLDKSIGLANVLFVLTADHGGMMLPEFLKEKYQTPAGRIKWKPLKAAYENTLREIDKRYGDHDFIVFEGLSFYYDIDILNERSIDMRVINKILKKNFENVAGIERILTKEEILSATPEDKIVFRMKNMINPVKSPDAWILQKGNWVYRFPYGTGHGTPYDYDAHVPLLLHMKGMKKEQINDRIATVDIAPTIAKILDVEPPAFVDGKTIREFVEKR